MEPQDQPLNTSFNPNTTMSPQVPNPTPVTPPPVAPPPVIPDHVYSSGTVTAPSAGGGLMSIVVGVVVVAVIVGGAWWWVGNNGPTASNSNENSYENPFGTPGGDNPFGTENSVAQNNSGPASSGPAQSCTSAFSKDMTTRDYYGDDVPPGVVHGTFKPTSSVSSKFSSSVQLPSGLKVISKFFPDQGSQWSDAELYIFCATNINSVISFYNSFFGNASNWQLIKMTTNGQGLIMEAWAAVSKINPVTLSFGVTAPSSLVSEPVVSMVATYVPQQ